MRLRTGRFLSLAAPATAMLLLISSATRADDLIQDSGLWAQLIGNFNLQQLNPKLKRFRLGILGESRIFDDFDRYAQSILRITPGFEFNDSITLYFGYTWIPTFLKNGATRNEHDINQALYWKKKSAWGGLTTRTMLEWRFVEHDSQTAARLRQKVIAKYRLAPVNPHLSLVGWEELFLNINTVDWGPESGFDQNRAFAGFNWQFDQAGHYALETGYLNRFIHHADRPDTMQHMLLSGLHIRF